MPLNCNSVPPKLFGEGGLLVLWDNVRVMHPLCFFALISPMIKKIGTLIITFLLSVLLTGVSIAQPIPAISLPPLQPELPLRYESGAEIGSELLFRGIRYYNGAYLTPYVALFNPLDKKSDIVFQLLGNFPLQGERDGRRFYELSPSIFYQKTSGPGTASFGGIGYFYDGNYTPPPGNTAEIFGSLAFDAVLNPTFTIFQDIDESRSRYFEFEIKHDMPWDFYDASLIFSPYFVAGYSFRTSEKVYGSDGLNHYALGVKAKIKREWGILQPRIEVVTAKDELTVDTVLFSLLVSFKG